MRPALEVADIVRHHGPAYLAAHADVLGRNQHRVLAAIEACRTATLGGHVEQCTDCGLVRVAYNSCRNRHAKRPFGGPEQVLAYLGRYTHRVAIANSRLISLDQGRVSFRWKDYRHHDKPKIMTLDADEFIRRFLLHVLPEGFRRIRHYGFLANGQLTAKLAKARALLAIPPPPRIPPPADYRERYARLTGRSLETCPDCGGRLVEIGRLARTLAEPTPATENTDAAARSACHPISPLETDAPSRPAPVQSPRPTGQPTPQASVPSTRALPLASSPTSAAAPWTTATAQRP